MTKKTATLKRMYVVDFATTCSVSVEAESESEARSKAEDALERGSQREWTAQMWENLQIESVSEA